MAESGNKPEKKLEEANFEVSSLSEVRDENGNGIFHMQTKTKIVAVISALILLSSCGLIYLSVENYIAAEIWQMAIWGLCGILAIYSMFAKSILSLLLNLVLFAGLSFIPIWHSGYKTFQPVIEKFSTEETAPIETPAEIPQKVENEVPKVEQAENKVEEKNSELDNKVEEKISNVETDLPLEDKPARENNLRQDLPSI